MNNSSEWHRTHNCGQLRKENKNEIVTLMGWVASQRDHGGVIFVDLRDRWGITQVVFRPDEQKEINEEAKKLRMESVIGVKGEVVMRPKDMINSDLDTGEIEVNALDLVMFNEAKPTPFLIKDPCDATDENRLKYRYLDLRRPSMQKNLILRHQLSLLVRKFFHEEGFVEIETPFLMKSTPEGARDYLVPSRVHKGKFYALPQSPQTYKQLLMVSGFDRYFQIVRCFRDEDLRADRQPEFTQIDVEMSFVEQEDVMGVVERLMVKVFHDLLSRELQMPFKKLSYEESMAKYGIDRPDLRFGMEIVDVSEIVVNSGFQIFDETVGKGGMVRGICLKKVGRLSRKRIDELTEYIRAFGAKGLIVIQKTEEGIVSSISKFVSIEILTKILEKFKAGIGDVIFIIADKETVCCESLGNLRIKLAREHGLIDKEKFIPVWIVDFPLLEWSEIEGRHLARHHPFTSPQEDDLELLDSDPGKVRAKAYDFVLNGSEIAGGSIRNHRRSIQERMFKILGMDEKTAEKKFGFLMEALEYGAPPHGGIAFGYDRLVAILVGEESIREVIAFPKTTSALSLMDDSPTEVGIDQLKELGLRIITST